MEEKQINTEQVDLPSPDLADEKEEDFQMIIPEFGICGAEAEGAEEESKGAPTINYAKENQEEKK